MKPTQCEYGSESTPVDRCPRPATRKWGDHWFCDEHGARDSTTEGTVKAVSLLLKAFKKSHMTPPLDSNVRAVQDLLARRAAIGLTKYGVTTERTDLTTLDFMAHLQEELLDAAVYLQRIISDTKTMNTPIKTSDRLPNEAETNDDGDVLGYFPECGWQIVHVSKLWESKKYTHWLPLPLEPLIADEEAKL